MYHTPNTSADEFIKYTTDIISKVKGEKKKKELIIGMDHNLDLLHSDMHQPTQKFLNTLLDMQLFPTITRLSRITHRMATLIDNIFESEKFHRDYDSAILVSDISDHLPLLCLLKQTKILDKQPLTFESRSLNNDKLLNIKKLLSKVDWYGLLNKSNADENFNIFSNKINNIMDEVAPVKTVQISARDT